jgi:hypothetical protein
MPYAREYPAPGYPSEGDRVRINASLECPAEHEQLHGVLEPARSRIGEPKIAQ